MHTKFHCYASKRGAECALGALDEGSVRVAARLNCTRIGCERRDLELLCAKAVRQPLVKHRAGGLTVWAVPTVA